MSQSAKHSALVQERSTRQGAEVEEQNIMQYKTMTNNVHIFGILQLLRNGQKDYILHIVHTGTSTLFGVYTQNPL